MNRSLVPLILLLVAFACSKTIPTTSTTSANLSAPTPKTSTPKAKTDSKPLPSKHATAYKASPPAKVITTYQSTGNDVADVVIKLLGNKKFSFQMTIKPRDGEKKDDRLLMGGSWKFEGNRTVLLFERKDVDLNALFDKNYSSGSEFEILDAHRVAIDTKLSVVHIWGIACEKK